MQSTSLLGMNPIFNGLQGRQINPVIKAPDDITSSSRSDNPVSLDSTRPENTSRILNNAIIDSLRTRLAEQGIEFNSQATADDYTPEKVATRILDFVSAGLVNAGNDEQRAERLQQAREGIEKGLSEARDILDSLGVLSGEIKDNVNRTEDLLQKGLNQLAQGLLVDLSAVGDEGENTGAVVSGSAAFLVENQSSRYSTLEIETREGDLISISISNSSSSSALQFQSTNADGTVQGNVYNSSSSFSASYTVKGNLNEQEKAAISNLIGRIDKVTDTFFDGNVQAAFKQAASLEISSDQLASFALNMEQNSTTTVAAYQQTASNGITEDSATPPANLLDIGKFGQSVLDILNNFNKDVPFADFETQAARLLKEAAAVKNGDINTIQPFPVFNKLVDALGEISNNEDA